MHSGGQPKHDRELSLLRLMAKVIPAEHRARPATQERDRVKLFFRDSPTVCLGLTFIPAVHHKRSNARHSDQDRIAENWIGGQKAENGIP